MDWFDQQWANTALPLLVLFPFCCGLPALGLSLAAMIACAHPKARRNALIVLCISVPWTVFSLIFVFRDFLR